MSRQIQRFALSIALCTAAAPLAAQAPLASDSLHPAAEVDERPRALNLEEFGAALFARYPSHLKQTGVSGEVTVSMVVGADGLARGMELVSSSDTAFNAPTLEVASLLRFSPARVQGRPVSVRITVPIGWRAVSATEVAAAQPDADAGATAAPSTRPDTYELKAVTVLPRIRNARAFAGVLERLYPPMLRQARQEGRVNVRFRVGTDGTISDAQVFYTSDPRFSAASLEAVQHLRMSPAQLGARRVPVWVELPIHWSVSRPAAVPDPWTPPMPNPGPHRCPIYASGDCR